jgi:hypothetical protein
MMMSRILMKNPLISKELIATPQVQRAVGSIRTNLHHRGGPEFYRSFVVEMMASFTMAEGDIVCL